MTRLERAKSFLQKNAIGTALVILPLAAAAPAEATPVFNVAGAQVAFAGLSQDPVGTGTFSALPNGGIRFVGEYDLVVTPASGSSAVSILMTLSGTGSGSLSTSTIPAHYDFTFSFGPDIQAASFGSSVDYLINNVSRGSSGPLGASASGDLSLTGWRNTPPLQNLSSWSVTLEADFQVPGTETLHLSIPPHSIDIAPAPSTPAAVPEPASLLLVGTGTAWVVVRRRRLRRSPE